MRYIWQHIENIIKGYDGSLPLSHFLKSYFKNHPKLGSRDRKLLSEMVYCSYRVSLSLTLPKGREHELEEAIKACLFLCSTQQTIAAYVLDETWDFDANRDISERVQMLQEKGIAFDAGKLFPHAIELSAGIEKEEWLFSMLQKPKLFIRIRKNKDKIIELLHQNDIPFEEIKENCFSLPIGAAIDQLLSQDAYVVQDASSQETGNYFHPQKNETWYDCCSGAGGKALLLKDMEPSVKLTVSDTRESILQNLKSRFQLYGLELPSVYNIDLTKKETLQQRLKDKQFDAIICDAPCSGSGTWARTPEQLYFFKPETTQTFSSLQKSIAANAATCLKPGGRLIYITCSIFKEENEDVVAELTNNGLQIESMQIINGINKRADSMFVAMLKK